MDKKIDVLYVKPNKVPEHKIISAELEEYQKMVDGYIEFIYLGFMGYNDVAIICNEEGKLLNLPINRKVADDVIYGSFLIVGVNEDEECSLTKEQIDKFTNLFDEKSINETYQYLCELTNINI